MDDEDFDPLSLWQQYERIALETNDTKDWAVAERAKKMYVLRQLSGLNNEDQLDDD